MDYLLLQAAPGGGFGIDTLLMFGIVIVIFYFFMIRPQSKKAKETKTFQEELTKGMDVVTASGILGRINKIDGDIVTVEVGTKTYIQVVRNAISKEMTDSVFNAEAETAK